MFDHVEFGIKSYEKSLKFYSACLSKLGYKLQFSDDKSKVFGIGAGEAVGFLLSENGQTAPKFHIAFKASSENQVNEFHQQAIANGGTCNGKPGLRKEYAPNYYAAFVIDPDGHNVEALYRA